VWNIEKIDLKKDAGMGKEFFVFIKLPP